MIATVADRNLKTIKMKNFVVALNQKFPEVKKAHKQIYYVKATSKFTALLNAVRICKSYKRLDGSTAIIESYNYAVQLG